LPALILGDLGAMNIGPRHQVFLGEALRLTDALQVAAEQLGDRGAHFLLALLPRRTPSAADSPKGRLRKYRWQRVPKVQSSVRAASRPGPWWCANTPRAANCLSRRT